VYHYCHFDGRQDSFLCPRGTMFNQEVFVCDWWYNTNCEASESYYRLNDNLYQVNATHPLQFEIPTHISWHKLFLDGDQGIHYNLAPSMLTNKC
jgi:hypothetical protein